MPDGKKGNLSCSCICIYRCPGKQPVSRGERKGPCTIGYRGRFAAAYRSASKTKFRINNPVHTQRIGCTSFVFPLQIFTMQ